MSGGAAHLLRRRSQLLSQCDQQRAEIALHIVRLDAPIRLADRLINVMRCVRRHPLVVGAAAAALLVTQRRGLLKWGRRGLVVWRAWRALRGGRRVQ